MNEEADSPSQPDSASESAATEVDNRPTVETQRLVLRPFQMFDVDRMSQLINDREIAANTRTIDFPYPDGAAELWIRQHPGMWLKGEAAIFAVCLKVQKDSEGSDADETQDQLVGAMGLEICETNHHAELGYWIGRPFWGQGICTEAAKRVVQFGFEQLGLHKIHAHHLVRNPASGRILEKVGMIKEGLLRGHVRKWGVFEDVATYGILRSDFETANEHE